MRLKICYASSSGGHFEQLSMLEPLMDKYDSFIVTEKTDYKNTIKGKKIYYLHQVNRMEKMMPIWMILNSFKSLKLIIKERPDIVITTGVLSVIPICLLSKLFGKKLIYIESFAKIHSPTKTGKFLYKYSDRFYVQRKSMKKFYPEALYLGGIY